MRRHGPSTCETAVGGLVTDMVDAWMARILDGCAHPAAGTPPAPPACGTMHVKFYRPGGYGCGQTVTFSTPQPPAFVACIATAFSTQRCSASLFLEGDARTFDLCAPGH